MEQTGESYTAALAAVREEHEPRLRKPEAERIREGLSGGADGGYRTRPLYDLEQD